MATGYTKHSPYTGNFGRERSHWERQWENEWQQSAINRIEDYLVNQPSQPTFADPTGRLDNLTEWNQDRINEIATLDAANKARIKEITGNRTDITALQNRLEGFSGDTWRSDEDIQGLIDTALTGYQKKGTDTDWQSKIDTAIDNLDIPDATEVDYERIRGMLGSMVEQYKPEQPDWTAETATVRNTVANNLLNSFTLDQLLSGDLASQLDARGWSQLSAAERAGLEKIATQVTPVDTDTWRSDAEIKALIASYGGELGYGANVTNRTDQNILELVAKNLRDDDGKTIWEKFAALDETGAADRISMEEAISSGLSNNLDYIKDTLNNTESRNTQDIAALKETLAGFDYESEIDTLKDQLEAQGLKLDNLNQPYKAPATTEQISTEAIQSLINLTVDDKLKDIPATDTTGIENAISMVGGDLKTLQTEFANLGIQDKADTADLEVLEGKLAKKFGESLTGLSSTYDTKISELGGQLENILGKVDTKVDQDSLDDQFAAIQQQYQDTQSDLTSSQQDILGQLEEGLSQQQQQLLDKTQAQSELFGEKLESLSTKTDTELAGLSKALDTQGDHYQQLLDKAMGAQTSQTDAGLADIRQAMATESGQTDTDLANLRTDIATAAGESAAGIERVAGEAATARANQAAELQGLLSASEQQQSADLRDLSSQIDNRLGSMISDRDMKLAGIEEAFGRRFDDYSKTQARNFQDLGTTWGNQLAQQESTLQNRIDAQTQLLNNRLSGIAGTQNYRMLTNNAPGIKIRRSKAYKSGRTSRGTGQLGRSMRISSLNL